MLALRPLLLSTRSCPLIKLSLSCREKILSQAEANILELIALANSQYFSLLQWWASISVGLVAIAHFASDRLNLFLLAALSVLYIAYTGHMVFVETNVVRDLINLRSQEQE